MTKFQHFTNYLISKKRSVFTFEIFKALNDISGSSLKELFVRSKCTINLQSKPELVIPSVNNFLKVKAVTFWPIYLELFTS